MLRIKQEAREPRSDRRQPGSRVLELHFLTALPFSSGGGADENTGLYLQKSSEPCPPSPRTWSPSEVSPASCSATTLAFAACGTNLHPAPTQPHSVTAQTDRHSHHSSRGIAKPPVSSGIYHTSASNFPKIDLLAVWVPGLLRLLTV